VARPLLVSGKEFNAMKQHRSPGFTLVEMAITILVIGLVVAFAVPSFRGINQSQQLHGAVENIAAQLRLAREKALSSGVRQPIHIQTVSVYHIHYPSGVATQWTLPNGITFLASETNGWYTMERDGRCTFTAPAAGIIELQDRRGNRDTVSVQQSGLVLD
jgi:prepilin-type N-terminal cleavage/methylation domain-containing protein